MKKNQLRGIAVLGVLLLAFIVISFAAPFAKTGVFWVAFLFGIIAIGVSGGGCYRNCTGNNKRNQRERKFAV